MLSICAFAESTFITVVVAVADVFASGAAVVAAVAVVAVVAAVGVAVAGHNCCSLAALRFLLTLLRFGVASVSLYCAAANRCNNSSNSGNITAASQCNKCNSKTSSTVVIVLYCVAVYDVDV